MFQVAKSLTGPCGLFYNLTSIVLFIFLFSFIIQIYFVVSTIFVLAAVMNIAFSSLPSLEPKDRNNLTILQNDTLTGLPNQQPQQGNGDNNGDDTTPVLVIRCTLQQTLRDSCKSSGCFSSKPVFHASADLQACTIHIDKTVTICYGEYLQRQSKQPLCAHIPLPKQELCRLCHGTVFLDNSDRGYPAETCEPYITNINKTCLNQPPKPIKRRSCLPLQRKLTLCYKNCMFGLSPEDDPGCASVRYFLGKLCFHDHLSKEFSRLDCAVNDIDDDNIDCDSCYVLDYVNPSFDKTIKPYCEKQLDYFQRSCIASTVKSTKLFRPTTSTTTTLPADMGLCHGIGYLETFKLCLINRPPPFRENADIEMCSDIMMDLGRFCTDNEMFNNTLVSPSEGRACSQSDCFLSFLDASFSPEHYNLSSGSICALMLDELAFECFDQTVSPTDEPPQKMNFKKSERNPATQSLPKFPKLSDGNITIDITGNGNLSNFTSDFNFTDKSRVHRSNSSEMIFEPKIETSEILPVSAIEKLNALTDTIEVVNVFLYIEYVVNIFFTLDLLIRGISCPSFKYFLISFLNLCDILALVSCYEKYICYLFSLPSRDIFIYLQMVRVFRLFRVTKNITAFKILEYSLRKACKDMLVMSLYLFIAMMIFSNFIYFFEDDAEIPSIPAAWWWCIITMTTVGYGDMYPKTVLGKVIGVMCAISGVVLFSMIIPVIVQTFLSLYQYLPLIQSVGQDSYNSPAEIVNTEQKDGKKEIKNDHQTTNIVIDGTKVELNEINVKVNHQDK